MADEHRWSERDRDWRDDRSWQEGRRARGQGSYGGGERRSYASQGSDDSYDYGRGRYRNYDEYGRDPGASAGYGESREYGRGGGYGATGRYAGQGGYGLSAQGGGYREERRRGQYGDEDRRGREDRSWLERAGERVSSFFGADEAGSYRGRGPKGYRRSDERIREDVCDQLTDDPWLDASNIEVEVRETEVMLKGAVGNREDKRRAEFLCEAVSGVKNVQNQLRIEDQAQQASQTARSQDRDKGPGASPSRQA